MWSSPWSTTVPDTPELCLDGPDVRTRGLAFRPLAQVLDVLQRLWTALAQAAHTDDPRGKGRWNAQIAGRTELATRSRSR